jgi:hypothetical protein
VIFAREREAEEPDFGKGARLAELVEGAVVFLAVEGVKAVLGLY